MAHKQTPNGLVVGLVSDMSQPIPEKAEEVKTEVVEVVKEEKKPTKTTRAKVKK
jgi:hypothetical protein